MAGIKNIVEKENATVDLHSAVYLFHLVQVLIKHVNATDAHNALVGEIDFLLFDDSMIYANFNKFIVIFHWGVLVPLCKSFLSRKWYAFDGREMQGGESNSLLEQLLKGYFKDAKFGFIRSNLQWMQNELSSLLAKGGTLDTFPCIKL